MGTIIIKHGNNRDIKLSGEEICSTTSSDNNCCSYYSGRVGRWTKLTLYRTKGGKYICEQIDYTRLAGSKNRYSSTICDNVEQIIEFFGHDWLAKELYEKAGIEASVEVE